jgi:hypothetical protein
MQWKSLPIQTDEQGKHKIYYTSIYRLATDGSLQHVFENSVKEPHQSNLLGSRIVHIDFS